MGVLYKRANIWNSDDYDAFLLAPKVQALNNVDDCTSSRGFSGEFYIHHIHLFATVRLDNGRNGISLELLADYSSYRFWYTWLGYFRHSPTFVVMHRAYHASTPFL